MKNMTLENIAAACGGQIYYMREDLAQETAKGVVIDSRQIEPGYIFVATKGERVDGHRFIPDVFAKGRKRTWDRVSLWKTVLWL